MNEELFEKMQDDIIEEAKKERENIVAMTPRYVTDGKVLLHLPGLRWICCRGARLDERPGAFILEWNYKGSDMSHYYGKDESAEKLRNEMFTMVVDALASTGTLVRSNTYMAFQDEKRQGARA